MHSGRCRHQRTNGADCSGPGHSSAPAYALLIRAGLEGIRKELAMPRMETASGKLPATLRQAVTAANRANCCKTLIPQDVLGSYLSNKQDAVNDYTKAKKEKWNLTGRPISRSCKVRNRESGRKALTGWKLL